MSYRYYEVPCANCQMPPTEHPLHYDKCDDGVRHETQKFWRLGRWVLLHFPREKIRL